MQRHFATSINLYESNCMDRKLKIIADKFIPFLSGRLESIARVEYLDPVVINSDAIKDADALIVRTRTRCDERLLAGSSVKFIATATIGYDHIDTDFCKLNGISWSNAAGCNAQGVCDYVEEVLYELNVEKVKTIGIIGVGHVGSLVAEMARRMGYKVLLNDPPKGLGDDIDTLISKADVITFHTPLVDTGEYPTRYMCDTDFLRRCKPNVVIINAARGGIIDEQAALGDNNVGKTFVIDTWENEPDINQEMLNRAKIATYHIAGYTLQGKLNATNICLNALCKHFGLEPVGVDTVLLPEAIPLSHGWLKPIDFQLRQTPKQFERLRETYKLR